MSWHRALRALASMTVLASALWPAAPAAADIYWTNESGNSIGRAGNDGSNEQLNFITGATTPGAVAVGGGYVYWVHGGAAPASGKVGRARLDDPGDPQQAFVTMAGSAAATETSPSGIALDGGHVYWTQVLQTGCSTAPCGKIGSATLDGLTVDQRFIPPSSGSIGATPCGLAMEPDHLYWADAASNTIGRAHGPFEVNPVFITGANNPCGVAFAGDNLYWANRGDDTIGRANVGTGETNQQFIQTGAGNTPCGVAADATYLYWTTTNGKIWRWRLDGSHGNVIESIVTDALTPCGIAVDPTAIATPSAFTYQPTTVGSHGDIQAFAIENTSSSVLDVTSIKLTGANPGDFRKTGDGCTVAGVAPGGLCILNFQFSPTATGVRSATVQITSNATNSFAITLSGSATPVVPPTAGLKRCKPTITVGQDGVVTLCRATNPPAAIATATLTGKLQAAAQRLVVLGRGRATIPAGHTIPILAQLTRAAENALHASGSLTAQVQILVKDPRGRTASVRYRVTLLAKRGTRPPPLN